MAKENANNSQKQLTNRQAKAIGLLLSGMKQKEIASQLKVGESTIRLWLTDSRVQEELQKGRSQIMNEATMKLLHAIDKVIERLLGLVDSENQAIQLKACQFVLSHVSEAMELQDLKGRVERLERAIESLDRNDKF